MKKLIITIDDFGLSQGTNDATIACVQAGVVRSVNIMANMEYAEQASDLKNRYPFVSLGIHYNLTVGKPILPESEVASLVNSQGFFHGYEEFRRLYKRKKIDHNDIIKEINAQYKKYTDIVGKPDYWNTHENIHVAFYLYKLFTETSMELDIKKMRSHQRIYLPSLTGKTTMTIKWYLTNPLKTIIINAWQGNAAQKGIKSPDGVIVSLNEADKLKFRYMCSNLKWRKNNVAELIIHPSTKIDSNYFGNITSKRIEEFHFFSDCKLLDIAKTEGIDICGFEGV